MNTMEYASNAECPHVAQPSNDVTLLVESENQRPKNSHFARA